MEKNNKIEFIEKVDNPNGREKLGRFKCHCGKIWTTRIRSVNSGVSKSCGCLQKEAVKKTGCKNKTHGMSLQPEYYIYKTILQRCTNPNNKQYKDYGAIGITLCDRWLESFENFYEDMGSRPEPKLTVDRVDNTKGYYKENCSWRTVIEQANNKRNNHIIEFNGKKMTIANWARERNIPADVIGNRLNRYKWSIERALTEPVGIPGANFKKIAPQG